MKQLILSLLIAFVMVGCGEPTEHKTEGRTTIKDHFTPPSLTGHYDLIVNDVIVDTTFFTVEKTSSNSYITVYDYFVGPDEVAFSVAITSSDFLLINGVMFTDNNIVDTWIYEGDRLILQYWPTPYDMLSFIGESGAGLVEYKTSDTNVTKFYYN